MTILRTVQAESTLCEPFVDEYKAKVTEFADPRISRSRCCPQAYTKNWEILGIMPCSDPPRHDTAKTIC